MATNRDQLSKRFYLRMMTGNGPMFLVRYDHLHVEWSQDVRAASRFSYKQAVVHKDVLRRVHRSASELGEI